MEIKDTSKSTLLDESRIKLLGSVKVNNIFTYEMTITAFANGKVGAITIRHNSTITILETLEEYCNVIIITPPYGNDKNHKWTCKIEKKYANQNYLQDLCRKKYERKTIKDALMHSIGLILATKPEYDLSRLSAAFKSVDSFEDPVRGTNSILTTTEWHLFTIALTQVISQK